MVQLMLNGFGGDHRRAGVAPAPANPYGIECYHVNAQVSRELDDIGGLRIGKLFLLLGYCAQAVWCRFRYGVTTFYYVPAPGKPSALYRDWLVMFLCRPFFRKLIFHWHSAGLGHWLETHVSMRTRAITFHRMREADLSIVLSNYNQADACKLLPKTIGIINNGIPDPCPDFERDLKPRRQARLEARRKIAAGQPLEPHDLAKTGGDPQVLRILYVAHCTREKGLFDTLEGVRLAHRQLRESRSPFSVELQVAGLFVSDAENEEFQALTDGPEGRQFVKYLGFVEGAAKSGALREADLFCFPSYYRNENQPVNLIEAMAFGLPILTTRWRSIPELFPPDYPGLVDIRSPGQIAAKLQAFLQDGLPASFRELFLKTFVIEQHLQALASACHALEEATVQPSLLPAPGGKTNRAPAK